jgi:hypothetical protein
MGEMGLKVKVLSPLLHPKKERKSLFEAAHAPVSLRIRGLF